MNLDKFKGVTTSITPPEIKNPEYIDSLLALRPKKQRKNILPIIGSVAAAVLIVIGVTFWALIGRGIRTQKPVDDPQIILPADTPDDPTTPTDPDTPDDPTTPTEPDAPDAPTTPTEPDTPGDTDELYEPYEPKKEMDLYFERPHDTGYQISDLHLVLSDVFVGRIYEVSDVDKGLLDSFHIENPDNAKVYTVSVDDTILCNFALKGMMVRIVYEHDPGGDALEKLGKYLFDGRLYQYDMHTAFLSGNAFTAKVERGDELVPTCELSAKTLGECKTLDDLEKNIIPQIDERMVMPEWMYSKTATPIPSDFSLVTSVPLTDDQAYIIHTLRDTANLQDNNSTIARPMKYTIGVDGEKVVPKNFSVALKGVHEVFTATVLSKEYIGDVKLDGAVSDCKNAYLYTVNIDSMYTSFITKENMTAYLVQSADYGEFDIDCYYLFDAVLSHYNGELVFYSGKMLEVYINEDSSITPLNDVTQKLLSETMTLKELEKYDGFDAALNAINNNEPHLSQYNSFLERYYGKISPSDSEARLNKILADIQKAMDVDYDYSPGDNM